MTEKKSGLEAARTLQQSFDKWVQENKALFEDYIIERNNSNVYKRIPDEEGVQLTRLKLPPAILKLESASELKNISFLIQITK